MNQKLTTILRKVSSNQSATVRFRDKKGQQTLQVKVALGFDNLLHGMITGKVPRGVKFSNKTVHLVQKCHGDYFFMSGHVSNDVQENPRVLSIAVFRALWFVRKRRGSVSWFGEKQTYEEAGVTS
jgi:hypothetical protein